MVTRGASKKTSTEISADMSVADVFLPTNFLLVPCIYMVRHAEPRCDNDRFGFGSCTGLSLSGAAFCLAKF